MAVSKNAADELIKAAAIKGTESEGENIPPEIAKTPPATPQQATPAPQPQATTGTAAPMLSTEDPQYKAFVQWQKDQEAAKQKALDDAAKQKAEAEDEHAQLTKSHGQGYVKAQKGKESTVFTAVTWSQLGPAKGGWKKVVETPPEVLALNKK